MEIATAPHDPIGSARGVYTELQAQQISPHPVRTFIVALMIFAHAHGPYILFPLSLVYICFLVDYWKYISLLECRESIYTYWLMLECIYTFRWS